ncbi:MAG: hypothetical protein IKW12_02245 [Clostridia bacterium]|nr:hypothetical protein [Clostridia bacterium]
MLKNLSTSKSQLKTLIFLFAVVLIKTLVVMFRKGKPSVGALVFGLLMCVFYVLLFFSKFPTKKEEFFTGQNLIRIIAAVVVFIGAFSLFYVNLAFNLTMVIIAVVLFCVSDTRFIPIGVVASLALFVIYEPFAFTVIPAAIFVLLVLVAPRLKEAKTWEKIVFSAALVSLVICFVCVAYELRFNFSFSTLRAFPWKTVPMVIIAALFVVCAVFSLKTVKGSNRKGKKNKSNSAVKEKKADYLGAFAYIAIAVFAVVSATLESKYAMCSIVSLLTSMFVVCTNGTQLELIADKVAVKAGKLFDKVADKVEE